MEQQHGGGKQNNKTLRKRLQRQLEFYLSDSNLRQDKFLQQSMDEQGFVAIELFLAFNKLKAMNATEKMVRDAVEKSSLIRISADRTAIAPIELPFDKDDTSQERTVYVENFGVEDDHDSLRKRLSKFGKVNLVSMPRFPQSKRFKGFAFVEFTSAQAAEDAVKAALAMDPELQGLRAMSKVRWQEMKQQLKEQLTVAALQGEKSTGGNAASGRGASLEQRQTKEAGENEPEPHLKPRGAQKKRKTGGGHIHFDADDDEDEVEDNQEHLQEGAQNICPLIVPLHDSFFHPSIRKKRSSRTATFALDKGWRSRVLLLLRLALASRPLSPAMRSALVMLCAAAFAALVHAQADPDGADFDNEGLETQQDVFTPEPSRVFMPFCVPGWTNAYVPNIPETCSGAIAGFTDAPMSDADCHAPFQLLLERDTHKVRYGCFKCEGAFQVTSVAAPYATCGGKPICSALPLAYYRCFLKNDVASDIFSCLMDVDYQADN